MRVLICDDHRLFAEALAVIVDANGHDVVGYGATPEAAAEIARAARPDVCLVDLAFGRRVRVDGVAMIKDASPSTCVIVLSAYLDADVVGEARHAGASHCLSKDCDVELLARDLGRLSDGGGGSRAEHRRRPADAWDSHPLARFLTPRERDVLEGLVAGESTDRLAERLAMRDATVRTHVQSILGKLGVHSRVEAVSVAIANGFVSASAFDDRGYGETPGA